MKEVLDKYEPGFQHFDHNISESLMNTRDVDADDEDDFITASNNANAVVPFQPSRVPKRYKVEPAPTLSNPSYKNRTQNMSHRKHQKCVRSLEKQRKKELKQRKTVIA